MRLDQPLIEHDTWREVEYQVLGKPLFTQDVQIISPNKNPL